MLIEENGTAYKKQWQDTNKSLQEAYTSARDLATA